jgi:hypothetical protein
MQDICFGCKIIWLRYLVLTFTVVVSLFFGLPAIALSYVHLKNYCNGKTTNEMYAKKSRSPSTTSSTEDGSEIGSEENEDLLEKKPK